MKNREKWADKLIDLSIINRKGIAVDLHTHKPCACEGMSCKNCLFGDPDVECEDVRLKWLEAEYEPIDWSLVKVDTKILVSDNNQDWERRYFAKYEGRRVYAWVDGKTSWAVCNDECCTIDWPYAKLWEEDEDDE